MPHGNKPPPQWVSLSKKVKSFLNRIGESALRTQTMPRIASWGGRDEHASCFLVSPMNKMMERFQEILFILFIYLISPLTYEDKEKKEIRWKEEQVIH